MVKTEVKAPKIETKKEKEETKEDIDKQIRDIIEIKKLMLKNRKIDLC